MRFRRKFEHAVLKGSRDIKGGVYLQKRRKFEKSHQIFRKFSRFIRVTPHQNLTTRFLALGGQVFEIQPSKNFGGMRVGGGSRQLWTLGVKILSIDKFSLVIP